jgi:hypothetical protein
MPSLPSHKQFCFQTARITPSSLIDLCSPCRLFQSSQDSSQTDPTILLIHSLLSMTVDLSDYSSTHLLARCDPSGDPSARITRRSL